MQLVNKPGKLVLPFAATGSKRTIPATSQIGITAGAASLPDGFPPLAMIPETAGGVGPSGMDMNGILYELSAITRWANAGGGYPYDAAFASDSNVGGYPKGARVMRTDGQGYWLNTVDDNATDPEAGGAGWVPDFSYGASAITMTNTNYTLSSLEYGKPVIIISGLLTADLNLIFPNIYGQWLVINNTTGGHSITGKTASGVGVEIAVVAVLFCDATNIKVSEADMVSGALPVIPQQFGAFGDGTTDDFAALTAMFATGKPWYIPYTSGGYKTTGQLTVNADGICDGFIVPTTAIGVNPVVVIADSGYSIKRRVTGLSINGSVALRTAGVMGIRVDCANAHLINCSGYQLNYGCVVRMFSVTLTKCSFWQNNTNLSAYARSVSEEVNALTIDGGNYDSAVDCGINIGDTSWPDALPAGTSHGVGINIVGGINTDGAENRIDNCGSVNITGNYAETTNTNCLWRLGGGGDGHLLNVNISGNFLKSAKYAILCESAVNGLHVGPNYLVAVSISEVKMSSDLYGLDHRKGVYVGCFANGQVVGIAFRSLALSAIDFIGWTLEVDRLYNGSYYSNVYPDKWYPTTVYKTTKTESMNRQSFSTKGVYYTTPSTGKAGTVSGNVFTFTTKSDSYSFNGGDKITTSPGGATYIRNVDWDTGIALLDGGTTPNGAATISQEAPYVSSVTYDNSPPAGTWSQGDICWNFSATVGQPKGWQRTAGAWVSMGNL